MAEHYPTHHQLLKDIVAKDPHRLVLKVPDLSDSTLWTNINARQFDKDIDAVGFHILETLSAIGITPNAIVSLWISGFDYLEILYLMGMSRAGYIPHVCGLTLSNPQLVFELMSQVGSKAIFYTSQLTDSLKSCDYPAFSLAPVDYGSVVSLYSPLPGIDRKPCDLAYIYHTSGSISGRPKPVNTSYKMLYIFTLKWKSSKIYDLSEKLDRQEVVAARAGCAHSAGMSTLLHTINCGRCQLLLHPAKMTPTEIGHVIKDYGVNALSQFAPALAFLLQHAKSNHEFKQLLQSLRRIYYGGAEIPIELDQWAFENNITLINILGSTECGIVMSSRPGKPSRYLVAPEGYERRLILSETDSEVPESDSRAMAPLYELVIPATALDRAPAEYADALGDLRTSDLFEKAEGGWFIWRGRADDWIKSSETKKTDTRAIENDVYSSCGDLVDRCVVLGHLRPSPALIVELNAANTDQSDLTSVKSEIINRLAPAMSHKYLHERIVDPRKVHIVERGVLPRTAAKGNIRRKIAEKQFEKILDAMYD